jgi:steroid 5-alpha reductase family enzyme
MTLTLLAIWGGAALLMLALWAWQIRSRDASIVDVAWAFAVGVAGLAALWLGDGDDGRRAALAVLAAAWAARLGGHLLVDRVLKAAGEDSRYRTWREQCGPRWNAVALGFFQAQAVFVAIFALPAVAAAGDARAFGAWTDYAGLALWGAGLIVGCAADQQLARWRRDPANAGRTCRAGLWRYSRHPNYFGEWLLWCAWPLLAIGSPLGWWLWLHPLVVLVFLLYLTGIPHTERRALLTRGEDYRRYQRSTSKFIPWPPARETSP